MATTEDRLVIRQLAAAREHLLARGDADAVKSLDAIIDRLGEPEPEPPAPPAPSAAPAQKELLTAQEAADMLGVTSVSPVWTWVGHGKLTTQWSDGWIRITRGSIQNLLKDPALQQELAREAELARILAPFDATDEDLAEMYDWHAESGTRGTDG